MNIEDILALVRAGYTRAEIDQMTQALAPAPEQLPEEVKAPEPTPAEVTTTQPDQAPAWADAITRALADLTKTVQTRNALDDRQPEAPTGADVDAVLSRQLHSR